MEKEGVVALKSIQHWYRSNVLFSDPTFYWFSARYLAPGAGNDQEV